MRRSPAAGNSNGNGRARSSIGPNPAGPVDDTAIVATNLHALESLYFAAMLEEARLFQVVDRLVAMFSRGALPAGTGRAGEILYGYWKMSHNRLRAAQRQTVYAQAFGFSRGDAGASPNREFNDLWLSFLSTLGMYMAEQELPSAARSVTQEEARRTGRNLAVNLSYHGDGISWFAARELRQEVRQIQDLLSAPQILSAFEAQEPWQVIERVAVSELGSYPNIRRARSRALNGVLIMRWLANHHKLLLRPPPMNLLKDEDIREQRTAASEEKKRLHPTDYDLVTACENWLSATGTQEAEWESNRPIRQFRVSGQARKVSIPAGGGPFHDAA